jgi:LysM repeat protein
VGGRLCWILVVGVAPLQGSAETASRDAERAADALPELAVIPLEAEPTPPQPPTTPLEFIHVVEPGESLERIARRYRVGIDELARDNGISDRDLIRAKTELRVRLAPVPDLAVSLRFDPTLEQPRQRPADERARAAPPVDAEALARRAEAELRNAHFEEALATADQALARIASRGDRGSRARLALVAGTAELALGDHEAALARFVEALDADPALRPDPADISPKVLRLLETARTRRGAPPPESAATATTE